MPTNPYLDQQAGAITNQFNRNFSQNTLPAIRSNAIAAGGYGGSRQGIAEGVAAGQMGQDLSNSLANLYGGAYENDMNRGVQTRGQDLGYATNLGNLGLGYYNATNNYNLGQQGANNNLLLGLGQLDNNRYATNTNFYTQQRGQDLSQTALGANLMGQGIQGGINLGQAQYGVGQQQHNQPWNTLNNYSNVLNQYTGLGGTTASTLPNSTLANTLGGALTGAQLAKLMGGGSGSTNLGFNPYDGSTGFGTGSNYGFQDYGLFI